MTSGSVIEAPAPHVIYTPFICTGKRDGRGNRYSQCCTRNSQMSRWPLTGSHVGYCIETTTKTDLLISYLKVEIVEVVAERLSLFLYLKSIDAI